MAKHRLGAAGDPGDPFPTWVLCGLKNIHTMGVEVKVVSVGGGGEEGVPEPNKPWFKSHLSAGTLDK